MQFIFLEGVKRSGNHLLVQWVTNHSRLLAHCNNYFAKADEELDDPKATAERSSFAAQLDRAISYIEQVQPQVGLISFEHPGRLTEGEVAHLFRVAAQRLGPSVSRHLHILRDPYNWMASFAKMQAKNRLYGVDSANKADFGITRENYQRLHLDYWSRWLRAYRMWSQLPETSRVDYNRFVDFVDYRRALCNRLDLAWHEHADAGAMSELPAQGSSFGQSARGVQERFEFALPLFIEFGIPHDVWSAGALSFPEVSRRVTNAISERGVRIDDLVLGTASP